MISGTPPIYAGGPSVTAIAQNTIVWQRWLASHGFGPLAVDGVWGQKTEAAYTAWNRWFNHAGTAQGANGPYNGQFPLARVWKASATDPRGVPPRIPLPGGAPPDGGAPPRPPAGGASTLLDDIKAFIFTPTGMIALGVVGILILRGSTSRVVRRNYARR